METYNVIFKKGETTGVYGISLVDSPAMESMFIALKKEESITLKAVDTEKRILLGAVLIPDKPVYRKTDNKEFNIIFPAETIRLASENFLKESYQSSSTINHDENLKLSQVTFVESWIKEDMINDKSVKYGFDEPIGTWFASMKVDNDEVWNDFVKTGKVKGFSIDGFFDLEKINLNKQEMIKEEEKVSLGTQIIAAIKDGFAALTSKKIELGKVMTADLGHGSITINFEGDTISPKTQLTMTGPDGDQLPVPDGEYTLEDGKILVVVGSLAEEVREAAPEENAPAELETDPAAPAAALPTVKSEKHTQEVFYQLSKEDFNAMVLEFGKQAEKLVDEKINAFKSEFSKESTEEIISLTKAKKVEKKYEEMTPVEKFRHDKNK